jgi:type I restriction-modification system DNA methylase subunit
VDVQRIVDAYSRFGDEDRFSRVVASTEIEEHNFNLSIGRYIDSSSPVESLDHVAALRNLRAAELSRDLANASMHEMLRKMRIEGDE